MNKWMIPLLLAAIALGFAGGRWHARPTTPFDPSRDLSAIHLADVLRLTSAQAAEIGSWEDSFAADVQAACDRHCAARCNLARELKAGQWDLDRARRAVERMCAAQQANEMATFEHIARVQGVLTLEQQQRFLDLLGQCLCATCDTNGASCCAAAAPHHEENEP
jgi:Spy/CpxP family protein refolding chaperone